MNHLIAEVVLILTVCLPVSGQCSEHAVATYSEVTSCLQDATALRGATQDDEIYWVACMAVDPE